MIRFKGEAARGRLVTAGTIVSASSEAKSLLAMNNYYKAPGTMECCHGIDRAAFGRE